MIRRDFVISLTALITISAGWGITLPLTKIAVSSGHQFFGLIFWQLVIGAALMTAISLLRGTRLPLHNAALRLYLTIAMIGTIIPNSASYQAIAHLLSGVVSILLSLVPLISFPIAVGLRIERFNLRRLGGLMAGLAGVMILVLPEASLPDASMLAWIPLAMIAPIFYACESNYVAKWGTCGLDPIQVLLGASLIGAVIALPLAVGTGQFVSPFRVWQAPEWALVVSSMIHVLVYAGYVWLVGRTGPVFAVQVGYLVTGFGVMWAMVLLKESYSPFIWAAMGLVLAGVFLVSPRRQDALASDQAMKETGV